MLKINLNLFGRHCWGEKVPEFSLISPPFHDPQGCLHQRRRDFIFHQRESILTWEWGRVMGKLWTSARHHQSLGAADGVTVSFHVTWSLGTAETSTSHKSYRLDNLATSLKEHIRCKKRANSCFSFGFWFQTFHQSSWSPLLPGVQTWFIFSFHYRPWRLFNDTLMTL